MFDIILIYFFTKRIRRIATLKGESPGKWQMILIGIWLGFAISGLVTTYLLASDMPVIFMLVIIACPFIALLIVSRLLKRLPDAEDKWLQDIGKPEAIHDGDQAASSPVDAKTR